MKINYYFTAIDTLLYSMLLYSCVVFENRVCNACEPKNPQITGVQKKLKRSVPHFFSVNVVPCAGMDELYYQWEIRSKGRGGKVYPQLSGSEPVYKFDGYLLDFSVDPIFDIAFIVLLKISHYSDFTDPSKASKEFILLPDEMHLEMVGGSERTHPTSLDLILDATLSKDLSFTEAEKPFLNNKFNWKSSPQLPSGVGTQAELVWTISAEHFKPGDVYEFILNVVRTKILWYPDTKEIKQKVTFVAPEAPDLNLQCVRNCLDPNPKESTLFKVTCVKNCDNLNYEWEIIPDTSDIEFGNGHDQLLIAANVFEPNQNVTVVVKSGDVAKSIVELHFMPELITGHCDIDPKTGVSGITNFVITCKNFKSPGNGELQYNVYMKGKGKNKVLLRSSPNSNLTNIVLSEGKVELVVLVRDTYYDVGEVELTVDVTPFSLLLKPEENVLQVLQRMVLIKLGYSRNLKTHKVEEVNVIKIFDAVIQTASIVLDVLETNPPKSEEDENRKHDILKHVLESIYELNVVSLQSADEVLSVLQKYYEKKEALKLAESPPYLARLLSKSLLKVSQVLFNTVSDPREIFITTTYINDMATDISKLWSEVAEEYVTKMDKWSSWLYPEYQYYESYEEVETSKFWLELNKRYILSDFIESVELLGRSFLYVFVPNQKPVVIETDRLILMAERLYSKDLSGKIFPDSPASHIVIPEVLARNLQKQFQFVDLQFATLKTDGKLFQPSVVTEKVIFSMFGDKQKKILETSHDFDLDFHLSVMDPGKLNREYSEDSKTVLQGKLELNSVTVHSIKLEPQTMVKIIFNEVTSELKVKLHFCYPTLSLVENSGVKISPNSTEDERSLVFMPKENEKTVYLGIVSTVSMEYSAKIQSFSCGRWDSAANKWDKTFCKPKNISQDFIVCSCSLASLFAGEFFVPPNSLNSISDINFVLSLRNNPLVAATVGVILLIWILLMIWAKFKDDRLKQKNYATVLKDNVPGDRYPYLVVFFTGIQYDGGTSADVGFQVIGSLSESRVHVIVKPNENDWLKRGSDDWFVFFTPENLGEIVKIRLWHNCKGGKPHWFCDRIVVQELNERIISEHEEADPYNFDIRKWFSLIWGDGKIYREFKSVSKSGRKFVAAREVLFNIRDKHLWLSVWARPTQSNFTSKERISSAVSFLMLSMLVSAMFYGVSTSKSASVDTQSSFSVTWRQFLIVAETMAITVPISMIISYLFRNSKAKNKNI